jgi:hypothetical protein
VLVNLPRRHAGHLYEATQPDANLMAYLEDAAYAPALRIIAIIALMEKMSTDSAFEESDRRHVDAMKTRLFWSIIGQEVDITRKDTNGNSFTSAFIGPIVPQTAHILDCCHIYSHITALPTSLRGTLERTAREPGGIVKLEELFKELKAQVKDSVNVAQLEQMLLSSPTGINQLQTYMYTNFIKLGILERVIYAGQSHMFEVFNSDGLESMRNARPVEEWVNKSYVLFSQRSKDCIKDVCDSLAVQSAGSLDDSMRAKIRAVS